MSTSQIPGDRVRILADEFLAVLTTPYQQRSLGAALYMFMVRYGSEELRHVLRWIPERIGEMLHVLIRPFPALGSVPDIFELRLWWTGNPSTCEGSRIGTTIGGVLGV